MLKRDTRVQIIIVENGNYILLKHLSKKENRTFWGVPGGGREEGETDEEAAVREAEEETGLKVELLPIKFEENCEETSTVYKRKVTFMAYPVSGDAHVGYDPEPEAQADWGLLELKWQDFWNDEGVDDITKELIRPFRELIRGGYFPERAAALTYKIENGKPKFLLVTKTSDSSIFVFPGGRREEGETIEETAVREAKEESGFEISVEKEIGFFFLNRKEHKQIFLTRVFLATVVKEGISLEGRIVGWYTYEEIKKLEMPRASMRFVDEVYEELIKRQ